MQVAQFRGELIFIFFYFFFMCAYMYIYKTEQPL